MGIKQDGEAVLVVLARKFAHERVSSKDLHTGEFSNWTIPRFNDAIKWQLSRKYIVDDDMVGSEPYETVTLSMTMEGRLAAESIVPVVEMDAVHALNRNARTLLVHLYHGYRKNQGILFSLIYGELAAKTGLDSAALQQAAQRLVERKLARWIGTGTFAITPLGIETAEDSTRVARVLPLPDQEEDEVVTPTPSKTPDKPDKRKVFVIHGRNAEARKELGYFLVSLGLEVVNFAEVRANLGGTPTVDQIVIAGMDRAYGVVALFTPDEHAWTRPEYRKGEAGDPVERWQARPNVIFEAGMAFGRNRHRVVFVKLGKVSLFTDVAGIHALSLPEDRALLRDTLRDMGCAMDLSSSKWADEGNFKVPVAGLSEVSPPDPFRRAGAIGS
jgi:predicted nucleotide-binding protein